MNHYLIFYSINMKKVFVLLFSFFLFTKLWSQTESEPPPEAMPLNSNIVLIDQLMKASGYVEYFKEYCYKKIEQAASNKKWNAEVVKKKRAEVNFQDFKKYTVYNVFSFVSESQLKDLIRIIKELNVKQQNQFFVANAMMQSNLDSFVDRYLDN